MLTDAVAPPRRQVGIADEFVPILDAIADGVTVADAAGRIVHANVVAAQLLGFATTDDLLTAGDVGIAAHAELRDEHGAPVALTAALRPGDADAELLLHVRVHARGDERWLRVRSQRLAGTAPLIVTTLRDVTAKKAAQLEALEHQRRLELALAAGQMGVFEWKIAENRVTWSPAVERMHGLPVGSFDGTFEAYQRDIHPDDRHHVLATTQATLARGDAHYLSYRIIRPDGEVRWLEAHGRVVCDDDGRPQRVVGVCRDVTEQREG